MGQLAYIAEVLSDSPVVFWKAADASGNPQDSSGNARHCTSVSGTPTYQVGGPMTDLAMAFDPSEDARRSTLVSTVTNDFTMEAWVYWTSGTQDRVVTNGSLGANGWGIYLSNAHKIMALAGGVGFLTEGTTALVTNTWHHIVVVRDSGNSNRWTYYLDGSVDLANAGTTNPNAPSGGFSGFGPSDGADTMRIAYVAVYQTALSSTQVSDHYAASQVQEISAPFIASTTQVFVPVVQVQEVHPSFISSTTALHVPTVTVTADETSEESAAVGPITAPTVGPGPEPPTIVGPVGVFIDDEDVTSCVQAGSVTRTLNRPASATLRMFTYCAPGTACSRAKVYIGNTLWFHGFITQISTQADEDSGDMMSEFTCYDPMWLWQWRPARSGPDSVNHSPGDFSNPALFKDPSHLGPEILRQVLLQSEDDADPDLGEGPLFIDLGASTFATGETDLSGAPEDYPMTISEVFELLVSTGRLDGVLTPIDSGGNMATLAVYNGDHGTDLTGSVFFDYETDRHNVRSLRMVEDSTNVCNKLWYFLGPRVKTAKDPDALQHWKVNVQGDDPAFNPDGNPQGAWSSATSYTKLDTVTHSYAVLGGTYTFIALRSHTSKAINEPGVGAKWPRFWALSLLPPGGKTSPPASGGADNPLGERIYDSRQSCGVRMEVRIYDGDGESSFRELYRNQWQTEAWVRAVPRTLIHVTPVRTSQNDLLPPGVTPVQVGDFDIGDLVTVSAGTEVRGGFTGAQRIYGYTISWDEDGVFELGEIQTSSDQEGAIS